MADQEIKKLAWDNWQEQSKTNPNPINPTPFVYGFEIGYKAALNQPKATVYPYTFEDIEAALDDYYTKQGLANAGSKAHSIVWLLKNRQIPKERYIEYLKAEYDFQLIQLDGLGISKEQSFEQRINTAIAMAWKSIPKENKPTPLIPKDDLKYHNRKTKLPNREDNWEISYPDFS